MGLYQFRFTTEPYELRPSSHLGGKLVLRLYHFILTTIHEPVAETVFMTEIEKCLHSEN